MAPAGTMGGRRWCCEPVPEFAQGSTRPYKNVAPLWRRARIVKSRILCSPAGRQFLIGVGRWIRFTDRCCGLDVHKKSVVACVITPESHEVRSFSAMTKDLLALADWLRTRQVTQVAMESTGVYWKPVYNLLEDDFTVMVVNASHMRGSAGAPV